MPVFKAAMKIALKNMGLILMYVCIVALSLILTIGNTAGSQEQDYAAASMKISLVDEDDSELSQALIRHLSGIHQIRECENDSARLVEDLYYREADYALRIPQGFGADPARFPLQVTEVPGSYAGVYLKNQIDSYLSQIHFYQAADFTLEQAISLADQAVSPTVEVLNQSSRTQNRFGAFFQFIPYGAICMLSYAIGNVLCAFMKTEVRKRIGASALTHRRIEWELLLSVGVFGAAVFGIFLIMAVAFLGTDFFSADNLILYLSNMAVMILVCMSLAYLIAMGVRSQESLSGIVNSLSLGMSFLCGVFVPLEILGEGVKTAAHFLPFYWYEQANLVISTTPFLSTDQLMQIRNFMGIQAAFALTFVALGAAVHNKRYY